MQRESDKTKPNQDLIAKLAKAGERLTESARTSIIDRGSQVIPELIAILQDTRLAMCTAPGAGYLPIHATKLLVALKAVEAVEPMLNALLECDPLDLLYSELIHGLKSFGPPVLESVLSAYAVAKNEEQRGAIAEVLSGLQVNDPRIFSIFLQRLQENVELGACEFAEYGDPAALPHLSAALDKCKLAHRGGMFANQEIIELAAAIEELGGTLTERQARLLQHATCAPVKTSGAALPPLSLSLPLCSFSRDP